VYRKEEVFMAKGNITSVELPSGITVRDLAGKMEVSPIEVIKVLMSNGVMANINQMVDFDTAAIVAAEFDIEAVPEPVVDDTPVLAEGELPRWRKLLLEEQTDVLVPRAPVVTILGHVDHGKTTLLDAVRHTDVAGGEAGGITQHIGAYQVRHNDQPITFLDTPGHAAFTAMRARGAQGADIVVLVVAANDGVMPQTQEAIAHAQAAQVPIIVALNKIDRPDANPEFVKTQLSDAGLTPDEWDGDTMVIPVSATQRLGIEDLLEAILLTASDMEIVANPKGKTFGTVIEGRMEKSRGVLATLLVQNGTLDANSAVCAGFSSGRIRAMFDYRGNPITSAGPSSPVQILGLDEVPTAGDMFEVYENEKEARRVVEERKADQAMAAQSRRRATTLEDLFSKYQAGETQELRLILKADVQGSLQPIVSELEKVGKLVEDIRINVLHAAAGNITESDIMLAVASDAIVVGFNNSIDAATKTLADNEGISVRLYTIIYRLTEDVEKALRGMLEPTYKEVELGRANVMMVFKVSKQGFIAGCRVASGVLRRNAKFRVIRNEQVIFEGEAASLKHEKEDVNEVRRGFECGVGLKGFREFEVGDEIVCYTMEKEN
jgi:translation initiation factor IF-2